MGLNVRVIYRAIEDGEIKATRLRGRLRVSEADLKAWLESNRI